MPPGPTGPRLINTGRFARNAPQFLDEMRARHGEIWTLPVLGDIQLVYVSEPELVKRVFHADASELQAGAARHVGGELMGRGSVLLLDGEAHKRKRDVLGPPLRSEMMELHHELIGQVCEQALASWPLGEPFALVPALQRITRKVIMAVVFGVSGGEVQQRLDARIADIIAWAGHQFNMTRVQVASHNRKPPPRKLTQLRTRMDEVIVGEIRRSQNDPGLADRHDMLAALLRARDPDGSPWAERDVRDQLVTLLIQGHNSTATATAWALERLMRHPEVMERLRAELESDSEEYLDAVLSETLRVRTTIPWITAMVVNQPFALAGYEIDVGALICPCAYLVHRRADLFPDPERFDPERFLDSHPDPYRWFPWGSPGRHCVGRSFATAEMKILLRTLAQHARLEPAEPADEPIVRRGVLFGPKYDAQAVLRERVRLQPQPAAVGA